MSLEQLALNVEAQLIDLGKQLWSDPAASLQDELERLQRDLRQAYDTVSRCRITATQVRRISANALRAALLGCRVETSMLTGARQEAWQHALALEQLRLHLQADRAELPYLEIACRNQRRHIARLEYRLHQLAEDSLLRC